MASLESKRLSILEEMEQYLAARGACLDLKRLESEVEKIGKRKREKGGTNYWWNHQNALSREGAL